MFVGAAEEVSRLRELAAKGANVGSLSGKIVCTALIISDCLAR